MVGYALIFLLGVFISSVSQVFLKKEAMKAHTGILSEYLNFNVIFAYCLFFGATILSVMAYTVIPLSFGSVLDSASYIFVMLFGYIFFNEPINKQKILAVCIICVGIGIYSCGLQ